MTSWVTTLKFKYKLDQAFWGNAFFPLTEVPSYTVVGRVEGVPCCNLHLSDVFFGSSEPSRTYLSRSIQNLDSISKSLFQQLLGKFGSPNIFNPAKGMRRQVRKRRVNQLGHLTGLNQKLLWNLDVVQAWMRLKIPQMS